MRAAGAAAPARRLANNRRTRRPGCVVFQQSEGVSTQCSVRRTPLHTSVSSSSAARKMVYHDMTSWRRVLHTSHALLYRLYTSHALLYRLYTSSALLYRLYCKVPTRFLQGSYISLQLFRTLLFVCMRLVTSCQTFSLIVLQIILT